MPSNDANLDTKGERQLIAMHWAVNVNPLLQKTLPDIQQVCDAAPAVSLAHCLLSGPSCNFDRKLALQRIRESEHLSWLHQLVKRCRICEGSTVNAISAARQPKQAENTEPTHKLLSSVVMLAQPEWHDAVTNPHCSLHRLRSTRPCQTHLMTACPSSLPVPTPHALPPSLHVPMELAGSCNSLAHTLGRGD